MIMGYGVIAVPTGIVTFEIASTVKAMREKRECSGCGHHDHDADAFYCKTCGDKLDPTPAAQNFKDQNGDE